MKTRSSILAALVCTAAAVVAQQPPQVGFVRVVNALAPGEGRMELFIDGENMFPKGYQLGQRTGGIGLQAGNRRVEVRKQGVEVGTTRLALASGETITLVAFAEPVPAEDDRPPGWRVKLLKLQQRDVERGYRLTVVSVCSRPEVEVRALIESRGKIQSARVKRLAAASIDLGGSRGDVELRLGDQPLSFVSLDDPGNYVVVLYDDPEGKVQGLSFYDPRFVIAG